MFRILFRILGLCFVCHFVKILTHAIGLWKGSKQGTKFPRKSPLRNLFLTNKLRCDQNIYDHPRNISPDLISHFISVLPLPCVVDGPSCIVESNGLPNSFEHSFWKFTISELRLQRLLNKHHWTQHEL